MSKKTVKKIASKDADQYMLRLPPGLRDRVARRAAENGRSMNTEIVEAIEKHLLSADRVTQLWDLFEKHRQDLEDIPHIYNAVCYLESCMDEVQGDRSRPLRDWDLQMQEKERKARLEAEEKARKSEG